MNKITPADISDAPELIARAKALSIELGAAITPGFELSVLYRLGSLLAPLAQRVWAWRVTRLHRRRGPLLARKGER